jgi:hypothetical protein
MNNISIADETYTTGNTETYSTPRLVTSSIEVDRRIINASNYRTDNMSLISLLAHNNNMYYNSSSTNTNVSRRRMSGASNQSIRCRRRSTGRRLAGIHHITIENARNTPSLLTRDILEEALRLMDDVGQASNQNER